MFKKKQELRNQFPVSSGYEHRNSSSFLFALPVNNSRTQHNVNQIRDTRNQRNDWNSNAQSRQNYNPPSQWNSGPSNDWNSNAQSRQNYNPPSQWNSGPSNDWNSNAQSRQNHNAPNQWNSGTSNKWNNEVSNNWNSNMPYNQVNWGDSQAESSHFTARRFLSAADFNEGFKPWLRRDMFSYNKPYRGSYGMRILRKMGWRPGHGLGKSRGGVLEPPPFTFKVDKRGLATEADFLNPKPSSQTVSGSEGKTPGKHPVTVLLELCTKNKWTPAEFITCLEEGPVHNKNFLIMVRVNGVEYRPKVPRPSRKQARAEAAILCLKALGENNWSM